MASLQDRLNKKMEALTIPFYVHFDLTYRCNLKCIHCYIPEKDRYPSSDHKRELASQNRTEFTTNEVFDILDQLAECGALNICFSGGEIFVRHDILDIIDYARKKRFAVSLLTNGTIGLDDDVFRCISDFSISSVNISVYSANPEIHDSVTRTPGSFDKSIRTIELLSKAGTPIKLKCPIMKTNMRTFKSVAELAESYGTDLRFDTNLTVGMDGNTKPAQHRISDDGLKEYYSFAITEDDYNELKEVIDAKCEDILNENPCGASHFSCYISPYGDVHPCVEIPINCGNLRERSFKDIWETSEEMMAVRAIKKIDLRKCPDCPEPDYCNRCMGQAYTEHGDLLAPSAETCRNVKARSYIQNTVKQSKSDMNQTIKAR